MANKNPSFQGFIFFLIFLMSGLNGLAASVFAAASDTLLPIIRHRPPELLFQGESVIIKAIVEGGEIRSVVLWCRMPGEKRFQKNLMKATARNTYEGTLAASKKNQRGIEYYIEAVDAFGNRGRDGNSAKPYFLETRTRPPSFAFSNRPVKQGEEGKKPFWKKTWFWLGVAAVIGGGIAAAGSGGGDAESSGTVIVE